MLVGRLLLILSVFVIIGYVVMVLGWWSIVLLVALLAKGNYKRFTAFGTARWADESDVDLKSRGLLIGRLSVRKQSYWRLFNPRVNSLDACMSFWGERKNPLVRVNTIHAAVFAPTGVGKGVSFVIPHLLTCPESTVVVDFKGENYRATAKAREQMGHRIVVLDPFHVVTQTPDTFNPLVQIDADSPLAIDD
jgi:type IV secretion system protein VirD4